MSTILKSLHGSQIGLDKDGYLTSPVGIKVPAIFVGTSNSEVRSFDNTLTASATATTIPNFGTATLPATSGANLTYNIAAPVVGAKKVICASGTSTGQIISSTSVAATFQTTGGSTHITGTIGKGGALVLEGISTAIWHVVSNLGCVFA